MNSNSYIDIDIDNDNTIDIDNDSDYDNDDDEDDGDEEVEGMEGDEMQEDNMVDGSDFIPIKRNKKKKKKVNIKQKNHDEEQLQTSETITPPQRYYYQTQDSSSSSSVLSLVVIGDNTHLEDGEVNEDDEPTLVNQQVPQLYNNIKLDSSIHNKIMLIAWKEWRLKQVVKLSMVCWSWFNIISELYSSEFSIEITNEKPLSLLKQHISNRNGLLKHINKLACTTSPDGDRSINILTGDQSTSPFDQLSPIYQQFYKSVFGRLEALTIQLRHTPSNLFRTFQYLTSPFIMAQLKHFVLTSSESSHAINEILYNITSVTVQLESFAIYSKCVDLDILGDFISKRSHTLNSLTLLIDSDPDPQLPFFKYIFSSPNLSNNLTTLSLLNVPPQFPWDSLSNFHSLTRIKWKRIYYSTLSFHHFFTSNQSITNYSRSPIILDHHILNILPSLNHIKHFSLFIKETKFIQPINLDSSGIIHSSNPSSILKKKPPPTTSEYSKHNHVQRIGNNIDYIVDGIPNYLPNGLNSLEIQCDNSQYLPLLSSTLVQLHHHPNLSCLILRKVPLDLVHIGYLLLSNQRLNELTLELMTAPNESNLYQFYQSIATSKSLSYLSFNHPHNQLQLELLEHTISRNHIISHINITLVDDLIINRNHLNQIHLVFDIQLQNNHLYYNRI